MAAWRIAMLVCAFLVLPGCAMTSRVPHVDPAAAVEMRTDASRPLAGLADPRWQVGQWWQYAWVRYADGVPTLDLQVRSVVAAESATAWTLATDNRTIAALNGALGFQTLGEASKGPELTTSAPAMRRPWYHFPLVDGQVWDEVAIAHKANGTAVTYPIAARVTNVTATHADIEVRSLGSLASRFDYDANVGWFTHVTFYNRTTGAVTVKGDLLATGTGFHGTLYTDTGTLVVDTFASVAASDGTARGGPVTFFDLAPEHGLFLGFVFNQATTGAQDSEVIDPAGHRYGSQGADLNGQQLVQGSRTLLVPGMEGKWRFSTSGASPFYSAGGLLGYGIHETQLTL